MAADVEAIVKRSFEAVRKAHNAVLALRTSRSTPQALSGAGSALDKLFNTLNSLATSPEVLASGRASDIFSVTMPSGISLRCSTARHGRHSRTSEIHDAFRLLKDCGRLGRPRLLRYHRDGGVSRQKCCLCVDSA
jgi:hypothetical protein